MPYYKNLNILFIHIPKTGGSSLEEYLKEKATQTLFCTSIENNILFQKFHIKTGSLQHLTYKQIYYYKKQLEVDFNESLKIITIVRNPYHRIVSDLFYFNLIDKNTSSEIVYKIIVKYIFDKKYDYHNIPQYMFLLDNNNEIHPKITIFRTENLNEYLYNYGFTDFNKNAVKNNKNIEQDEYISYLNNDSIKLINKFYKKDFELFNYEMKTPLYGNENFKNGNEIFKNGNENFKNENKTLKNQNEELKKQIHIMKNRFNSVFAAYEALLLLQEQTQKTLQQQNVILQKQGNEIKNMITI
jgi:hypothetical protein